MQVIATTLLVYLAAVAAVFGTQFAAVMALMARRAGTFDPERDGLAALLVSVPASSLALIGIAWLAAGRPRRERLRLLPGRVSGRGHRRDDRGDPRAEPGARVARDPGGRRPRRQPRLDRAEPRRGRSGRSPAGDPRHRRPRAGRGGAVLPRLHAGAAAPRVERGARHPGDRDRLRRDSRRVGARRAGDGHRDLSRAGHRAVRERDPGGDLPRGQQRGLGGALGRVRLAAGATA